MIIVLLTSCFDVIGLGSHHAVIFFVFAVKIGSSSSFIPSIKVVNKQQWCVRCSLSYGVGRVGERKICVELWILISLTFDLSKSVRAVFVRRLSRRPPAS
jgi:hypothetical protein